MAAPGSDKPHWYPVPPPSDASSASEVTPGRSEPQPANPTDLPFFALVVACTGTIASVIVGWANCRDTDRSASVAFASGFLMPMLLWSPAGLMIGVRAIRRTLSERATTKGWIQVVLALVLCLLPVIPMLGICAMGAMQDWMGAKLHDQFFGKPNPLGG